MHEDNKLTKIRNGYYGTSEIRRTGLSLIFHNSSTKQLFGLNVKITMTEKSKTAWDITKSFSQIDSNVEV